MPVLDSTCVKVHCLRWRGLDLRGGGVQVGQPHVGGVPGGGQLVHWRDEAVRLLVHVLQEADDADIRPHTHSGELRLGVSVVLGSVLLLLRGSQKGQRGTTKTTTRGNKEGAC